METPPKMPKNKKIQAAILTTVLEAFKNPRCSRINPPFNERLAYEHDSVSKSMRELTQHLFKKYGFLK
jgi:hypothetical protein